MSTSERISHAEWREKSRLHRKRITAFTAAARARRDRREPHPVEDFLFQYYPFPFSLLEHWHPGAGIGVEWTGPGPGAPFQGRHHVFEDGVVWADPSRLTDKERARLWWTVDLLERTAQRVPVFGCHGLHEWAMVYRGAKVRHEGTMSLRLSQREIDEVVESRPIHCTHFDAFRFFAADATGFNRVQPTLMGRPDMEQPACVHANMDLYKWAAKSMPWVGSDLLVDCFELALALRSLDMRASPYDVRPYGLEPIRIEAADGRKAYEAEQRDLAKRAQPLRLQLVEKLRAVLESAAQTPCQPSF